MSFIVTPEQTQPYTFWPVKLIYGYLGANPAHAALIRSDILEQRLVSKL